MGWTRIRTVLAALALCAAQPLAQSVHYVDDDAPPGGDGLSWATAFQHPVEALDASVPGDEIRIAQGEYLMEGAPPEYVEVEGVTLRGGYGGITSPWPDARSPSGQPAVLHGDVKGDDGPCDNRLDNTWVLLATHGDVVLDGLTLRGTRGPLVMGGAQFVDGPPGYSLEIVDCVLTGGSDQAPLGGFYPDAKGGAIGDFYGGPITVRRSQVIGNCARLAIGVQGPLQIIDSIVADNTGVGARALTDVTVTGSSFLRNEGGGLSCDYAIEGTVTVLDSEFIGNRRSNTSFFGAVGGGAYIDAETIDVQRTRFVDNVVQGADDARGGGLHLIGRYLTLLDCEFSGNRAEGSLTARGGGLMLVRRSSSLGPFSGSIARSTFVENHADGEGGGLQFAIDGTSLFPHTLTVANSILWNNTTIPWTQLKAQASTDTAAQVLILDHSNVQGLGNLGPSNLSTAPLLSGRDGPDGLPGTPDDGHRLLPGSPGIDAGDSTGIPADAGDLSGRLRLFDDPATADTGTGEPGQPIVDMGAYEFGAPLVTGQWFDRGNALAGALGEPRLVGAGEQVAGTPYGLTVTQARPTARATLVLGLTELSAPFKGGVMVPNPDVLVPLAVSTLGTLTIDATWPRLPAGEQTLWWQVWVLDPDAPLGYAATNALSSTTP